MYSVFWLVFDIYVVKWIRYVNSYGLPLICKCIWIKTCAVMLVLCNRNTIQWHIEKNAFELLRKYLFYFKRIPYRHNKHVRHGYWLQFFKVGICNFRSFIILWKVLWKKYYFSLKEDINAIFWRVLADVICHLIFERKELMQETQHTQQTAIRTTQNQDRETTWM